MKIKTLVVDNNPVLLKAVAAILDQEGCEVQSARTGLEALEVLEHYSPDILFTDLIMPLVSGEQLCRIIRSTKKHDGMFIVVLSAIILEDRERILRDINYDICIAKGNLQEMRHHLQEALEAFKKRNVTLSKESRRPARIPDGLKPSAMASELLSEKRHLSMILSNLDEGILELSNKGKIVTANQAALNIFASREELLIGVPLHEVEVWGDFQNIIENWTKEQLVDQEMGVLEITEETPLFLGDRVVIGSFVPVSEAESVFGLCILRDITRQYQAEKNNKELDDAIRLAKKMDAMSCMASGVAHDFNNLLTVICGNLDIVSLHGKDQSRGELTQLTEDARKAALAAVDLTRQISCFSNFGIVKRENVCAKALVSGSVEQFFSEEKGEYELFFSGEDSPVCVDPEEISVSISNVLQNAKEASSGKKIEVHLVNIEFTSPELMSGQYIPAGNYARIDIRDLGKGIAPELLFKVFDPYYSTKERGTLKGMGLGLTVVYATLRNHGGYVLVKSELGKETTVSLYLPIVKDDKKKLYPKGGDPVEGRSVLLVEPYKQMGEIGKIMLSHLGFAVTAVGGRLEAIQKLKHFKRSQKSLRPLVILDLSESGGDTAMETCRMFHEIDAKIKVIAMSGTVLHPVMANCREYGFANILTKPYSIDSLKHITNTVLSN